jgi:hypothetical protein
MRRRGPGLAAARAVVADRLREVLGADASQADVEAVLHRARAWEPASLYSLFDYLARHPDGLTAPSATGPAVLPRLLDVLTAAGHGRRVGSIACAICSRTARPLRRRTADGRLACGWCITRGDKLPCVRCGRDGYIATTTDEGRICRSCYRADPSRREECARCGRHQLPYQRLPDGRAACQACHDRPKKTCIRCGTVAPVGARSTDGAICTRCYTRPDRLCGVCGELGQLVRKATDDQPATCKRCYRNPTGECSGCGRVRPVTRFRRGDLICQSCRPRPRGTCGDCGRPDQVIQARWPIGPVCPACYLRRRSHPAPCTACGTTRVLVGRAPDGTDTCGPCSGVDVDFSCKRCSFPGDIYADGTCLRCIVTDNVEDLLSPVAGQGIAPHLAPVAAALRTAEHPDSVHAWLGSSGARILASLVEQRSEISHAALDELPQGQDVALLRGMLVLTGVLPARNEPLGQLIVWARRHLDALPPHQAAVVRPFTEWDVIRAARRDAEKRFTGNQAKGARERIRAAGNFLAWLDEHGIPLADVRQDHVDAWTSGSSARKAALKRFLRWTHARRITGELSIARQDCNMTPAFITDQELTDQLRRCLHDRSLPLEVRIVGALTCLYGQPIWRLVELTTDRFHADPQGSHLVLDQSPVLLPPRLAELIEEQIKNPRRVGMLDQPADGGRRFLFPGRSPHQPRSESGIRRLLKEHGLATSEARHTAMLRLVSELPTSVLRDLLGIHINTATRWADYAQTSWSEYLQAQTPPEYRTD